MSITILPMRLQLLTLPRESMPFIMHAIVKNLYFRPKDTFFSYTENSLEVSIVADVTTVATDFPAPQQCPGLVVCPDPFRALQIDMGVGLDNSAQRINEISAPLAKAGVSIFYLSTYQTDYVFVKERRMPLVISTLQASHFDFLDLELFYFDHSPPHTPQSSNESSRSVSSAIRPTPLTVNPHLVPNTTTHSPSSATDPHHPDQLALPDPPANKLNNGRFIAKKTVPAYTLSLVGLSREYIDSWAVYLIKIMFYAETISPPRTNRPGSAPNPSYKPHFPTPPSTKTGSDSAAAGATADSPVSLPPTSPTPISPSHSNKPSRFFSYTATEEGISVVADDSVLNHFPEHFLNMSTTPRPLKCIQIDLSEYGLDRYGIVYSMADPLSRSGINLLYMSTYMTANILVNKAQPRLAIFGHDLLTLRM
ncbi:hypothetical protein DFS34DRAFT_599043 [Phlyctochytrium arcticum]|nr:hypothetical protein DFS34DRAFT_599043 [Phlyctochytrium arcticum]